MPKVKSKSPKKRIGRPPRMEVGTAEWTRLCKAVRKGATVHDLMQHPPIGFGFGNEKTAREYWKLARAAVGLGA